MASVIVLLLIILCSAFILTGCSYNKKPIADMERIDRLIKEVMKKSNVPGISVAILQGENTTYLNYGYADIEIKKRVTENTLFEIGSMSKAYTGLAILRLEYEGKLKLEDNIKSIIPWLKFKYSGWYDGVYYDIEPKLKISDFLYHTSGIPFETLGYIPEGNDDNILERTVRTIIDIELEAYPGTEMRYATINYDVLGLVIEKISGMSYEEYIQETILNELALYNTYLYHSDIEKDNLAKGYKAEFFSKKEYSAPLFRGNKPAGYILSNTTDMVNWMQFQMDADGNSSLNNYLLNKSHEGNTMVPTVGNYMYAAGWNVHVNRSVIKHGGGNPNYSSMLIIKPENRMGVCVLTNMHSNAAEYIANSIISIFEGGQIEKYRKDIYYNLDVVFSIIILLCSFFTVFMLVMLVNSLIEIKKGVRKLKRTKNTKVAGLLMALIIMIFLGFCVYYLPNILFDRLPWKAVSVWGSSSIKAGSVIGYISFVLFLVYVIITFNFTNT